MWWKSKLPHLSPQLCASSSEQVLSPNMFSYVFPVCTHQMAKIRESFRNNQFPSCRSSELVNTTASCCFPTHHLAPTVHAGHASTALRTPSARAFHFSASTFAGSSLEPALSSEGQRTAPWQIVHCSNWSNAPAVQPDAQQHGKKWDLVVQTISFNSSDFDFARTSSPTEMPITAAP